MGDFFKFTVAGPLLAGGAKIRIKPQLRAILLKKFDCTNEELDEALEDLAAEMTEKVHADMKYLVDRGDKEQALLQKKLLKDHEGELRGRNTAV